MSLSGLVVRRHFAWRSRPERSLLAMCAALALLVAPSGAGPSLAADATWKTHRDRNCGVELKYPATYTLEASGTPDPCETWIRIGRRDARRLHALFSLEITDAENTPEPARSARDLALQVATAQCAADGPDESTYCTNAEARWPFQSARAGPRSSRPTRHRAARRAAPPSGDLVGTVGARPELRDVPPGPGVVHVYGLDYAATAAIPLKLRGRFEADRLLAYANAGSAEIRLGAGATSFPLVIFYGAGIEPVTFDALLNGDNISGRFTPEPDGYQIVQIPLAPGLNTLALSVEGIAAGWVVRDVQHLVFRVE